MNEQRLTFTVEEVRERLGLPAGKLSFGLPAGYREDNVALIVYVTPAIGDAPVTKEGERG